MSLAERISAININSTHNNVSTLILMLRHLSPLNPEEDLDVIGSMLSGPQ